MSKIIIIDRKAEKALEDLLEAVHDLYEDNLKLIVELSIKAPPPIDKLFSKLINLNAAERQIISLEHQKFFPSRPGGI
jgi:hypothetical protein